MVFVDHPADYRWQLTGEYRKWPYCVQYRETDFNFVSRLLEHEGIYAHRDYDLERPNVDLLTRATAPHAHAFSEYERFASAIDSKIGNACSSGSRPSRLEAISQSTSFAVFHHEVGKPAVPRVDAEVGNVDDVRVFQLPERLGFDSKSGEKSLVKGRNQSQRRVHPAAGARRLQPSSNRQVPGPTSRGGCRFRLSQWLQP
jgi:hypothetical protein